MLRKNVLLALIPSAQVISAWAVGWPYAATALLAFGGFFTVEGALIVGVSAGRGRAIGQWAVALGLMVVGALIYQPSAMFYVVPLAGALIVQRHRTLKQTARWVGIHLGFVIGTLGVAYCVMSFLYATGVFVKSGRIAFEHHWGEKIAWFLQEPLPNALSLFVLNDNNHRDHALYFGSAAIVGALLLAGAYVEWRRYGRSRGIVWLSALLGLPVFACAVSLIASEHYATYRTILAMTAVLLCFLVASTRALTESWGPKRPSAVRGHRHFNRLPNRAASCLRADCGPSRQRMAVDHGGRETCAPRRVCAPRRIASAHLRHRLDTGGHFNGDHLPR